eukprot:scaffold1873_cov134-Skeletonema_dohrnii-CCMP3373.AAC.2
MQRIPQRRSEFETHNDRLDIASKKGNTCCIDRVLVWDDLHRQVPRTVSPGGYNNLALEAEIRAEQGACRRQTNTATVSASTHSSIAQL